MLGQRVPPVYGCAQTEFADHAVGQSAPLEILQGAVARRGEQVLVKELRRLPVGGQQPVALIAPALVIGILLHLRKGHMQLVGEKFHRLLEIQPLDIHDELDHAAAGLAAEAVIQLPLLINGEGSCLFPMEGAQSPVLVTVALERHIAGDNLNDVRAGPELVQPRGGKALGHARHLSCGCPRRAQIIWIWILTLQCFAATGRFPSFSGKTARREFIPWGRSWE